MLNRRLGGRGRVKEEEAMHLTPLAILLTATDQRIARFSLSWTAIETYAPEFRPQLTEDGRGAMLVMLERLDEWQATGGRDLVIAEGALESWCDQPHLDVAPGSLSLLTLAVRSFFRAVDPIRGEFRIITGLPPSAGKSLVSRLMSLG
jgi:hypothetical protein